MLPVGEPVSPCPGSGIPRRSRYEGRFVALAPLAPKADAAELYACSHGSPECEQLWTYMGYGPFESETTMQQWMESTVDSKDPLFFTVTHLETQRRVGMVSFLNIVPEARRLELGHIWYGPESQRTRVNTETVYLMLCETFDHLACRRAEWKCDALNQRSRTAALRLGFQFEGIFRQHLIVKEKNRDTAWFSMLNSEWPAVKQNLERWLYDNPDGTLSLATLNREK